MKKRTVLAWFALGHFANDLPIASLWIIVPTVGIAMDLSPAEVGLLFTICNIGGALAYLPAGIIADHASNRGRLLVATFWWVRGRLSAGRLGAGVLDSCSVARGGGHGRCGVAPYRSGCADP